jgi:UPF0716 protein FxsA
MTPRFIFAALFIGVPLLEIFLFIKVGSVIGAWPTVALVVLTALTGAAMIRQHGVATVRRARASLARDELPAYELIEGAALLIGGALLLMPGFFTDILGFLCLWPVTRKLLLRRLTPRIQVVLNARGPRSAASGSRNAGRIIDGEFTRKPDR